MNNMTYIVTGAAGHLGSHIVKALLKRGERVHAFLLEGEKMPDFIGADPNLLLFEGDVRNRGSLEPLFSGSGDTSYTFIHCAGIISITQKKNPFIHEVNVGGTKNVIDVCKEHGVERLVHVSSVHAIPLLPKGQIMDEISSFDPDKVTGQYAKTKAEATQLVLDAAKDGLDAVVVHPSGIIGPNAQGKGNILSMLKNLVRGRFRVAIHGGYDFVDVRDVADGILRAAQRGKKGECYILSNRFISLKEFFDTFTGKAGLKPLKVYLPLFMAKIAAPFAELYYSLARKTPVLTGYSLMVLSENSLFSHEKATRELGYKTRKLGDTMRDMALWLIGKAKGKDNN
ncbi:MAG: NAD-dependent epimerase/dehydratase family protein [Clostridiales bacterium]|nr:NAD-dependent epimerase/dehydratase family protein [Clostridiales bacterium]